MVSQKANDMKGYTSLFEAWDIDQHWKPLVTYTIDDISKIGMGLEDVAGVVCSWMDEYTAAPMYFVRSCPVSARAGVLDSIECGTEPEDMLCALENIVNNMVSMGEEKGGIMIQPYIPANASAVLAPGNHIIIGRDNDGITAGKDGTRIGLKVVDDDFINKVFNLLDLDKEKIEIEFVSNMKQDVNKMVHSSSKGGVRMKSYITQLRGVPGHAIISPPPRGVTLNGMVQEGRVDVKEIYMVHSLADAEALETYTHDDMPDGWVCYEPTGTLNSHAATLCRMDLGLPYICGEDADVKVGDSWVEAAPAWVINDPDYNFIPLPYDPYEYIKEFQEGINTGIYHWGRQYGWLSNHFHQFTGGNIIMNPQETAYLAGVFVGWLVNATLAVGLGEMRHASSNRKNTHPAIMSTLTALFGNNWKFTNSSYTTVPPHNRDDYYYTMENIPMSFESIIGTLKWLVKMYKEGWPNGYGGRNYMESCEKALDNAVAILELSTNVDDRREIFERVCSAANMNEGAIHNNAFFFNKFLSKRALDNGTAKGVDITDLNALFATYHVANHALSLRGMMPKRKLIDCTNVLKYIMKHGPTYWRKNPIFTDKNAPPVLVNAIGKIADDGRMSILHSGGGTLVNSINVKYVPCGHPKCSECALHKQWRIERELELALEEISQTLGKKYVGMMDVGINYEMYFPILYSVKDIELLDEVTKKIKNKDKIILADIDTCYTILSNHNIPGHSGYTKIIGNFFSKMDADSMKDFAEIDAPNEMYLLKIIDAIVTEWGIVDAVDGEDCVKMPEGWIMGGPLWLALDGNGEEWNAMKADHKFITSVYDQVKIDDTIPTELVITWLQNYALSVIENKPTLDESMGDTGKVEELLKWFYEKGEEIYE